MQRKRTFADLDREIVPVVAPRNSVFTSFDVSGPAEVTSDGLLVEVTRTEFQARCSKSNDKLVAYLRREVIRVTLALDDRTHRQKVLQGPPGCGKSVAAWFYALKQVDLGVSVCWVDVRRWVVMHMKNGVRCTPRHIDDDELNSNLYAELLILDEVAGTHDTGLHTILRIAALRNTNLIVVPSSQYAGMDYHEVRMKAWTLEEYKEAFAFDIFYDQVRGNLVVETVQNPTHYSKDELIENKFAVAGHCARWMFDMTTTEVLKIIRKTMRKLPSRELLNLDAGEMSSLAIYALVIRDPVENKWTYTSKVVAREISRRAFDAKTGKLHSTAHSLGAASMVVQAVEIDFLASILNGTLAWRARYIAEPTQLLPVATTFPVGREFEAVADTTFSPGHCLFSDFYHSVLDEDPGLFFNVVGAWMIPEVPGLGGFDCVQLCQRASGTLYLRFVQVALQADHPINMRCMHIFLESYNVHCDVPITDIEVVIVLPRHLAQTATPPAQWNVVGDVPAIQTKAGASYLLTVTRRIAGFKLDGRL
jgi:hypothetical protein